MEVSISTRTFRIDLILASSVAIMPNFLHSLIESRNPKLHLRSHMNGTFQITNLFTIFEYTIGGNGMNNVLIPRYMGSIPTEGKNSTSEGGGEDREVAVGTT
ncbi:hypothetical protein QL285_076479 [Trifolium repens]|nr:hypothetical protein QL285_076479 [Trifolium repens]